MRHTDFWNRLEHTLGRAHYRVWADQLVMSELGERTASEALDAGVPPKEVWDAVGKVLELPSSER